MQVSNGSSQTRKSLANQDSSTLLIITQVQVIRCRHPAKAFIRNIKCSTIITWSLSYETLLLPAMMAGIIIMQYNTNITFFTMLSLLLLSSLYISFKLILILFKKNLIKVINN